MRPADFGSSSRSLSAEGRLTPDYIPTRKMLKGEGRQRGTFRRLSDRTVIGAEVGARFDLRQMNSCERHRGCQSSDPVILRLRKRVRALSVSCHRHPKSGRRAPSKTHLYLAEQTEP